MEMRIEKMIKHSNLESKLRIQEAQRPIFDDLEDIRAIQPVIAKGEVEVMQEIQQLQSVVPTTKRSLSSPSSMDIFIF